MFPFEIASRGSFKRQIILTFVVGFFVLVSSFAVYTVESERENLYRDSIDETTGLAQALAVSSLPWVLANDVEGLQEVARSFQKYPELRYAMVITPTGRVLAHSDETRVGQFLSDETSLALLKAPPGNRIMVNDKSMSDVAVPISINNRHVGWARIGLGREQIAGDLSKMIWSDLLFVLLSTVLSLLASLLIASRMGSRIGTLVKVAEEVQGGNFTTRASIPGAEDEITKLANSLNHMLDVLARDEEQLRTASLYTRNLIEASLDPLVTINSEGKVTDVNEGSIKVTGVPREKLIGTDFSSYFTEPEKAREGYLQVFAQGYVTDYPLTIRHVDGRLTDVLYNASVYRDVHGNVLGVFAAARDVTESKRITQEFIETKNFLDNILQSSIKYSIIGLDLELAIVSWNDGAKRNYGYAAEEILGKHSNMLHTPEDIESGAVEKLMLAAYEKGLAEGEFERIRRDDSRFTASVVVTRRNDASGKHIGYLIMSSDISEKRRAEEQLHSASQYARSLIEASLDPLVTISAEGKITDVNRATETVTGRSRSELIGTDFSSYFTEPDKAREGYQQVFAIGYVTDYPLTIRHADGRLTDVLYTASVYKDVHGNVLGVFAAARDITELKKAEFVLRQSEEGLKEAQRIAHLGSWYLDLATNQIFWSEELYKMYGFDPALPPPPYTESMRLFTPESWERLSSSIARTAETGIPYELELQTVQKDGAKGWMLARGELVRDEHGAPVRVRGVAMDISERKRAEEELKESERRYHFLFSNNPLPMWIFANDSLGFLEVNDRTVEHYGYTRDEFRQMTIRDIRPLEDIPQLNSILASSPEGMVVTEVRHRKKDGSLIEVIVSTMPMMYGATPARIVLIQDITDRKHAEEELKKYKDHLEAEVQLRTADLVLARDAAEAANRAKSVFLSNMSHELRTPLNAILGFSNMMRRDSLLRQEQRENLDIINHSGEHLLTLINDVLEMAKIEAGHVQLEKAPLDLGALARDVIDMMHIRAQEKGLQLLVEQSSEFPRYIKGDEARLRQVLINLVGNAVKFTQQGGVTVRFGMKPHGMQKFMLIEVEDSGIGIKPEDQQLIFKPFVQVGSQAAQKGTGLGLTITQQYVELMGGKISVESILGMGTNFRVELPVEMVAASDVAKQEENIVSGEIVGLAPNQPQYRILIVEDQLENQLLLARLMKNVGLQVKVAENGAQALDIFRNWSPHLVWMDRRMPVMDGLEATRRIRELPGGKEVKIIAVTASAFTEQRNEMLEAGMDDFVRKPYRFNEIYERLTQHLGVQYAYANTQAEQASDVILSTEMLAVLPADLRQELRESLESLEDERIAAAIRKIADRDPKLHKTLSYLAGSFDYPAILKALQEAPKGNVT